MVIREVRDTTPVILHPIGNSFAACDTGNGEIPIGEIPIGGGYEIRGNALTHTTRAQIVFTAEGNEWLVSGYDSSGFSELIAITHCKNHALIFLFFIFRF